MVELTDWEARIGRRLRLRDLHVFFAVVRSGSMAKAASRLRVTQPAVSKAIADLEATLGVRLFDRSPQGVEPTRYGDALVKCGTAVFDELRQGIKGIEFLSDPTVGELLIGCPESIASSILPPIVERFAQRNPRVFLDVDATGADALIPKLIDRSLDLVLAPTGNRISAHQADNDLNIEKLFDDELIVAASTKSRWAHRRKVDLADLVNERWILTSRDDWSEAVLSAAFRGRGLSLPKISMRTLSVHLRANLVAGSHFVAAMPRSVLDLYGERFGLKVLPVELPRRPWPVVIVTLRHRTLSPVAERFIACCREVVKSMSSRRDGRAHATPHLA
jgi:DNA-binding transcriptional LysR family regulator